MYRGKTVGVVVPAYNEEGFVGDVLATLPGFVDRVYAVDDHSTDDTWAEILEHAKRDRQSRVADGETEGRVVPIRHQRNRGAGGAIKTGYLRALDDGVDAVVTVDADGQMDPDLMARILDPVVAGEADYAKGNRLASGEYRAAMPRFRLVGNWLLTLLTNVASGYWRMKDPQNGYTAISRTALRAVDIEGMYEYYGYCNDLLVKLNAAGMRVADVPMPASYGDEESSIRYASYIPHVSGMLLRNFLWRIRTRYREGVRSLAACYAFGAIALVSSVLSALALVAGGAADPTGTLPTLAFGALVLCTGVALDRRANRHLVVSVE